MLILLKILFKTKKNMLKSRGKDNKDIKIDKKSIKKARKIFTYLKPYRSFFFLGWIFLILSSTAGLLFPYLLGQLLGGDLPENTTTNNQELLQKIDLNNINSVAILLLFLFIAQSLFSFFRIVIFTKVTENTMRDIRKDAFEKLIFMPMEFFNKNKVGDLTSRIASDITLIQDTLRTTIAEFIRQLWFLTDRKSTRLNSSHVRTSYAVFCLKKKNSALSSRKGLQILSCTRFLLTNTSFPYDDHSLIAPRVKPLIICFWTTSIQTNTAIIATV